MTRPQDSDICRATPEIWSFEALYAEPPVLDAPALQAALAAHLGQVDLICGDEVIIFSLRDYCVNYSDKQDVPSQIMIIPSDKPVDAEEYAEAVQQTWDWPDKAAALAQCRHALLVTEMMGRGLAQEDRVHIFRVAMQVLIEHGGVTAVSQTVAACLLNPQTYLENQAQGYAYYGLLNVRFYTISNHPGDMVMDSLGLSVFGVPDVQCHFRELEPGEVMRLLFNTAVYLIQQGDVIEDGHTVAGIPAQDKWRCQHEEALIGPEREVLDINPGASYAAGHREH